MKMKASFAILGLSCNAAFSEGFAIQHGNVLPVQVGSALSGSPAEPIRQGSFSGSDRSGMRLAVMCVRGSLNSMTQLSMSSGGDSGDGNGKKQYSRDLYLREEAESPFRKVRFFVYTVLAGGALTSLAVSGARVAAGLSGINTDLLSESLTNVAVDVVGLGLLAVLFQRDLEAQESRLKRASKGAELAKLQVRASKRLVAESDLVESRKPAGAADGRTETFTVNLSSLRRGRGIEKRVVIAVGGSERVSKVLDEASRLRDQLEISDLLVVPVVLPSGGAPEVTQSLPDCVALPVGASWLAVVQDEAEEARKQGVDVSKDGFCVILKKNGRVGQRTKGIFLAQMVGEVESRKAKGFDVANI